MCWHVNVAKVKCVTEQQERFKQGRQEAGRERHREKQRERRAVGRGQQGWAGIQGRLSAMQ